MSARIYLAGILGAALIVGLTIGGAIILVSSADSEPAPTATGQISHSMIVDIGDPEDDDIDFEAVEVALAREECGDPTRFAAVEVTLNVLFKSDLIGDYYSEGDPKTYPCAEVVGSTEPADATPTTGQPEMTEEFQPPDPQSRSSNAEEEAQSADSDPETEPTNTEEKTQPADSEPTGSSPRRIDLTGEISHSLDSWIAMDYLESWADDNPDELNAMLSAADAPGGLSFEYGGGCGDSILTGGPTSGGAVTIYGPDGSVVGTGQLEPGNVRRYWDEYWDNDNDGRFWCLFTFTVPDLPLNIETYSIRIEGLPDRTTFGRTLIARRGWHLDLPITMDGN